jgi:hypothetical protein
VDWAWSAQAISGFFEAVEKAVMLQDFLHTDGRFDGLEVNEQGFGHSYSCVGYLVVKNQCGSGIEPLPWEAYYPRQSTR